MSFFSFINKNDTHKNYLKSINKIEQNQKQIECITKVLVEHADVPQEIIDLLIDSVQENATLEYELSRHQNKLI